MQSLPARHGKCTIKGGALAGTQYDAVAPDRLRKASKRYTGDSDFQKFAKSFILLEDLKEENVPPPCRPVVAKASTDLAVVEPGKLRGILWKFFFAVYTWSMKYRYITYGVVTILLALLIRPRFARVIAKLWVSTLRLVLRRVLGLMVMLLEGLLDEIIYQIDFLIRDALPVHNPMSETAGGSSNWISHILSGSFGAAVAIVATWRRTALGVPAQVP